FGHAFESLSDYAQINHGEAISIGMVLAAKVAHRMGLVESTVITRTTRLLAAYRLPTDWPKQFVPEEVLEVMRRDK
ncbi:3-dehydroquinate synthase, partial [Microbacteriaceae bacterium K1510]|nr:3-dehydroquinate synthase [Microbacteriaceae bacterium K1510]